MHRTPLILTLLALTVSACAAQPVVPMPSPLPSQTATSIPATSTPLISASLTPPASPTTTSVPTSTSVPQVAATATSIPPVTSIYNPYAVVRVLPDDVLNIRAAAGVGNRLVGTLQPTASGVMRMGASATADGDLWVEVQNPSGGTGWVNADFLTESVSSASFCTDSRVLSLIQSLQTAMLKADGDLLASLVSPVHGMDVRLWRYGTVANYSPAEAAWVFQSDYQVSWGAAPGTGDETLGTFNAQPLPKLKEVLSSTYSLHCNDALDLALFSLQPWPLEYANINFYTLYKPGSEPYGGLDWRAWTVGVEYVQGQPKLFALIHYQWEP